MSAEYLQFGYLNHLLSTFTALETNGSKCMCLLSRNETKFSITFVPIHYSFSGIIMMSTIVNGFYFMLDKNERGQHFWFFNC